MVWGTVPGMRPDPFSVHLRFLPPLGRSSAIHPDRTRRRVLVWASTFPTKVQPLHGVFVKERAVAMAQLERYDLKVVSPTPYFPPIKAFPRWYALSQIPKSETIDSLEVLRPRYPMLPKIGGYFHAGLMDLGVRSRVARMHKATPFELIDSHFVYPDGVAAVMSAQRLGLPVILTARGEDMLRFPDLPKVGDAIRWALPKATRLIALSEELAERMVANGADRSRVTVISNGVDIGKHRWLPRDEARRLVGLPIDRKIVVGLGTLQPRKGFPMMVEALKQVRDRIPDAMLVIVGGSHRSGSDDTEQIHKTIDAMGLRDHVVLAGPQLPADVHKWLSAGDLFALMSWGEGSPNALMEAFACGLPAVSTAVGSVPQLLANPGLGLVMAERSATAAATAMIEAFQRPWDRAAIHEFARSQSWQSVAERVATVFEQALEETRS